MAHHGSPDKPFPLPPSIVALKQDAGAGGSHRHYMERSFSQDIHEGSQDLKEAAELTRNIILDLSLDGIIRWVSPSWTEVVGTDLEVVKDQPISRFIADDPHVFEPAIQALKSNTSKSHFVKFAVRVGKFSQLADMVTEEQMEKQDPPAEKSEKLTLELEGQGIMVYERGSGGESHTMWMLQPATEPVCVEFALPQTLIDVLGVGAEILAKYLNELAENAAQGPDSVAPPLPILCRVCERSVVPWLFEKHSDLCVQEHKAEMQVQMVQESLAEHRHAIVKILDAFEARQGRSRPGESTPQQAVAEYKGFLINPSPISSSAVSSTPGSALASPDRSRSPSTTGLAPGQPGRPRSFIVRRPLVRVVELILDLCDTAIEINIPSFKDVRTLDDDEYKAQSPQSESRISQVLHWQQPSSLDTEPGLAALSVDTEKLARTKVEAVHRHQIILEYSERIRAEYVAEVDACIGEALIKAERAAAGESLSSSESDAELQTPVEGRGMLHMEDEDEEEQPTPMPKAPEPVRATSYVGMKSITNAFRNPLDLPPMDFPDPRRPSSQAVSTGSSSPAECPTPKSHRGTLNLAPPSQLSNRRSAYIEDANDSDSSFQSSSIHSNLWRPDSPASNPDITNHLGRSASSRERKRMSMHLHGLAAPSPHRQHSPGRYPLPPSSPLRLVKPRLGSGELSSSPMVSPLVTTGEFMQPNPPGQQYNHHRRQSSINFSPDVRIPSSPRMASITQPIQQRAQPPSIKDFEVIKPISRGAFGSVYLSKKRITGEYFAIKVLRKSDMVAKNQVTNVKAERAIMMWQGESDFVAKLYWTFSSKDYLYLVMEYLNGGDCASLVKILGGLTEDWAKKYIAEVVMGVQHLHDRGIVHRDLKPDNLLIDSKGHLKLTDFGLSRMGLVGRQKRALKGTDEAAPDLLKQGPFVTTDSTSNSNSRSASFDFHGSQSPGETPFMTPALAGNIDQPSYFSLSRENSSGRISHRRTSEFKRSDSGSSHDFQRSFRNLTLSDSLESQSYMSHFRTALMEDDAGSRGSTSPDLFPLSQSMSNISQAPLPAPTQDLPLPTALYDPGEAGRRFVGTPDYLAPETINGNGQDEMCDWWSLGCIMFEFFYGFPPFNADTTEEVFDNILNRRIAWPDDDDFAVSDDAKDLMNCLMRIDPRERIGANTEDKFPNGGAEIQAHSWFADINWSTLLEDEAQFIPNPENPEDTEYFDTRGATLQSFPEELEDQVSPAHTPQDFSYPDRPHDALFRARTQVPTSNPATTKRGLMPLHIPPHVARDSRNRRQSEPVIADDFGNFTFKNLPVLEKANKDIVEKMRKEAMQAQARGYAHQATTASNAIASGINSPAPSLEGSPMLPMPVKRALSISKGHRPGSPSNFGNPTSSPSRPSQPSSPLLVQFSATPYHERRKTSSSSHSSGPLLPPGFFDIGKEADSAIVSGASSPIKSMRQMGPSPGKGLNIPSRQTSLHRRHRSHTVGSQDSDQQLSTGVREPFVPGHYKRKSQLFVRDLSPSSSDNESVQAKALLKVQRRRQSSRRMSQISFLDGPIYRPLDILICEDHPVSKMVLERLFEKLKCRTITAANGPEVLRYAVSQIQFDIIFMEFKLPLINGVDVARMIRDTKSANTTTPIVCVTGYLKDLPDVHHFDALMQKPPTVAKLTEELCKFCSWKPPPKDFRLSQSLMIPPSTRHELHHVQDSPSSVASSLAPTMPDSSYRGSSREDSLGSVGFFSDLDSVKADDLTGAVSRVSTSEWSRAGLGISDDVTITQKAPIIPTLIHSDSAPPSMAGEQPPNQSSHLSPHVKSPDGHKHRRDHQKNNTGRGDEGDDEDDDLGDLQVRARSPAGKMIRQTSKLGTEMMRTNSRGSVISVYDDRSAETEDLRRSLEMLEERIEGFRLSDSAEPLARVDSQIRTIQTPSPRTHVEDDAATMGRPVSRGHITPPVIFPREPGDKVKEIDMDATPMASQQAEIGSELSKVRSGRGRMA